MQINYPNSRVRRATAEFWYPPSIDNTLRAMDVPPIYAPYGTDQFWPNAIVSMQQQTTPDTSIAPNSGKSITVAGSVAMQGFGDASVSPASSPAAASATGQPIGPVSLVAPMPSITPSPQAVTATPPPMPCNPVSQWVTSNPLMAAAVIAGAYYFFGGHK